MEEVLEGRFEFRLGQWKGKLKWECPFCAFDTLKGEGEVRAHWENVHAPKPKDRKRVSQVLAADRWGHERQVVVEEAAGEGVVVSGDGKTVERPVITRVTVEQPTKPGGRRAEESGREAGAETGAGDSGELGEVKLEVEATPALMAYLEQAGVFEQQEGLDGETGTHAADGIGNKDERIQRERGGSNDDGGRHGQQGRCHDHGQRVGGGAQHGRHSTHGHNQQRG